MDMDFYGYLWICLSYDFVRVSYILCWLIAGLLNHQQYFRMSLRIDEDRSWHPKKWETKNLAESALVEIRMMASFSHPKMRSTWRIWAPGFLNPSKAPTREVITTIIGGTTKTSGWLADQEAAPLEPGYQVWWRLSLQLGGKPTSVRSQLPADPTMYGEVWFGCDEDEKGEQFWAACKYQVP